jgi:biopolymer transport protein ExbB
MLSTRATAFVAAGWLLFCHPAKFAVASDGPTPESNSLVDSRNQGQSDTVAQQDPTDQAGTEVDAIVARLRIPGTAFARWYLYTEPADRVIWGGLVGCALLGLGVLFERLVKLRRRRIVPADFMERFLDRLHEGKLDCGGALDHCEMNPSPAARIALAAVRRWGRPASDLERAVSLAHRVETDRLRRNVGSLRRIAVLLPLIGLLGTLLSIGRVLESIPPVPVRAGEVVESAQSGSSALGLGPAVSKALVPLTAGVIMATLALVAYDGLHSHVEKLAGALDRVGAETIDAIALAAPAVPPAVAIGMSPLRASPSLPESDDNRAHRSGQPLHRSLIRRDDGGPRTHRYDQQQAGF